VRVDGVDGDGGGIRRGEERIERALSLLKMRLDNENGCFKKR